MGHASLCSGEALRTAVSLAHWAARHGGASAHPDAPPCRLGSPRPARLHSSAIAVQALAVAGARRPSPNGESILPKGPYAREGVGGTRLPCPFPEVPLTVTNRRIVLIAGPYTGTTVTTTLPAGATIYVNGEPYLITTTRTVHGGVAEWTGRTL